MNQLLRLGMGTSHRLLGTAAALLCAATLAGAGCKKSDAATTSPSGVTHTTTTTATGGAGQGGGSSGGGSQGGGSTSKGGGSQGTGGAGGGQGGAGTGGSAAGGSGGTGGEAPSYLCSVNTNWTVIPGGKPVVATGDDDLLGYVTPDELTIAFLAPAASEVHYSDRSDSVNAFDVLRTLPVAAGWYAMDRVALSPDGLRIVVLSTDKKKIGQLTRKARGDAFQGAPDATPFAAINGALAAGESLGDMIVSGDDATLIYSVYSASSTTTIHVAKHASPGAAWTATADTFGGADLDAANGKRRQPTGISGDQLTLYFWDQQKELQRGAWRLHVGDPFTYFEDYPQLAMAVPAGNCKKLYFTGAGVSSKDIQLAFPE